MAGGRELEERSCHGRRHGVGRHRWLGLAGNGGGQGAGCLGGVVVAEARMGMVGASVVRTHSRKKTT